MDLVEFSHPISTAMPQVATLPDVVVERWTDLDEGDPLSTSRLVLSTHSGTHIDAPAHAIRGGATIDEFPAERFVRPAVVSDVSGRREIRTQDIIDGGPAPSAGDMLLLASGWDQHFGTAAYMDHPSVHPEVVDWVIDSQVSLMGMDMLNPDLPSQRRGADFAFPVHRGLLGNDVLILENLRGLSPVCGSRIMIYALPLIVQGGDAAQARVVGSY